MIDKTKAKGLFIVLEGIDGAGTTTQCDLLQKHLQSRNIKAEKTFEPSKLFIGKYVREALKENPGPSPELMTLLFTADRYHHYEYQIKPVLSNGYAMICDRYIISSLAYQGLDCEDNWIAELNRGVPFPDLTIFVDTDVEDANKRRSKRGGTPDNFENSEVQKIVAERYREIVKIYSETEKIVTVSGSGSIEDIHSRIVKIIDEII